MKDFERAALTAILRLRADAYGVSIHAKVEEIRKPRFASLGAVYFTLDRLEDRGLISSRPCDPTPERGSRSKRCYRIEALSERAFQESFLPARDLWETIADRSGKEDGAWGPRRPKWNPARPK
jgi:DNA-binding PadR family transcriptional regulator